MGPMPNPDAARPRVALFRAREDALGSARQLERAGFAVALAPSFEAVALAVAPQRRRYAAVIASSAKAFLADVAADRASPMFVAGARTAEAARTRGWRLGAPPAPDAAGLAGLVNERVPAGGDVLYLAGRDRKPMIEAALGAAFALEVVETYAAEARQSWRPAEIRALEGCGWGLHYSRRSAALAAELAQKAGLGAHFRAMAHVCLSDDVAAPLRACGAAGTRIAERPDEASLFAALIESAPLFSSRNPSRI